MINIGLQLYTVRDECEKDFIGTIKKVTDIGYKGLEFAGYYGMDAKELRKIIDDMGAVAVNAHVSILKMENDLDAEIEYANILGMKTITIPAQPKEIRNDVKALLEASKVISAFDERCLKSGIQLCYHNHDFEFAKVENEYILDIYMKNAKSLRMELDTFWCSYVGMNTVEYMKKNAQRLQYIHLKDMIKDSKPVFAEVGEGCLDINSFIKTAIELGVEWAFVEQDICMKKSLESVKISMENLKKMSVLK